MKFSDKIKKEFSGKTVLLLQGPVGTFFHRLAIKMKKIKPKFLSLILMEGIFFSIQAEKGASATKRILKISMRTFLKKKK